MKIKSIENLLSSSESFEELKGKLLLFAKDSDYYKFSGWVTAALLDYDDPDKGVSILAIWTPDEWYTFKYTRDDIRKMFAKCIEVVGEKEEDSFTLQ